MLKAGTKVRTLYQYGEDAVVLRKSKKRTESDVAYFGSRDKADQWHLIRFERDGGRAMCHRNMLAVRNDQD